MEGKTSKASLGGRLRWFLAFRGLSIREFAGQTGIPYRSVQQYLADSRKPGAEQLARIGAAGVDLNWLVTGRVGLAFLGEEGASKEGLAIVAADRELLTALLEGAARLSDDFCRRRATRDLDPLSATQVMQLTAYYGSLMIRTAARMAAAIEELAKLGAGQERIVEMLSAGAANMPDEAIERQLPKWADLTYPGEGAATDG